MPPLTSKAPRARFYRILLRRKLGFGPISIAKKCRRAPQRAGDFPFFIIGYVTVTVTCFFKVLDVTHCDSAIGEVQGAGGKTRQALFAHPMTKFGRGHWRHQFGIKALSSATTHVAMVRKLFPDWNEEILRLALSNETFREMCEEYGLAIEALNILEQRNRPPDVERMYEYRTLIKQLEKDLKHELLAAHDPKKRREM
ncbi:MAG TPA: hypothetical protein VLB05_03435 [Dongiaceae bacterium]|jgi:hypothetical protein|nr:hypothetical protein [Dongiaceae bacterium]